MSSEFETLKTNEFLRRRRLRLQQVREQSKEIAKKIRQRATVEKLRSVIDIDTKKENEYLQQQEKQVQELELLYNKGIQNVGSGHSKAALFNSEAKPIKVDISKLRGHEAAAQLKHQKEQKLLEQKKLLDRKLWAREKANELSREKSKTVVSQIIQQASSTKCLDANKEPDLIQNNVIVHSNRDKQETKTSVENTIEKDTATNAMAAPWSVETLPNDWEPSVPETDTKQTEEKQGVCICSEQTSKHMNLFAISDEMPSDLRIKTPPMLSSDSSYMKPSLTLVSEYLQQRNLRLREPIPISRPRKGLENIKDTIFRTRKRAEDFNAKNRQKLDTEDDLTNKKSTVTVYNHITKDSRLSVPDNEDKLVIRDEQSVEDAYSQAMRFSASEKDEPKNQKLSDMRYKIAMTKENVEKEYKDTMTFLNSLPKDKPAKCSKVAFMDDSQQQKNKEAKQHKMQQEFRKIQKECRHSKHAEAPSTRTAATNEYSRNQDFQYSWMPVPDSDASLAIHTIPTSVNEKRKTPNVKFSKVDSYHEYRSRHKHTPPEKDTDSIKSTDDENSISFLDSDSLESTSNSVTHTRSRRKDSLHDLSDAEKIIIYKIVSGKNLKRKSKSKLTETVQKTRNVSPSKEKAKTTMSMEEVSEGIYRTVSQKGDNLSSVHLPSSQNEDDDKTTKTCTCKGDDKVLSGKTPMQWECGDNTPKKRSKCPCCHCNNGRQRSEIESESEKNTTSHSTTSIKSAPDKIEKLEMLAKDQNFVKLLESDPQKKGTFYIGASGFLKNDDYEVVIQLRKKGVDAEDSDSKEITSNEQLKKKDTDIGTSTSPLPNDNEDNAILKQDSKHSNIPCEIDNKILNSEITETVPSEEIKKMNQSAQTLKSIKVDDLPDLEQNQPLIRNSVSKNVETQVKPSISVSTYTQTSMSSPLHRPVLLQMSSSTSTTYLSPPDMILPNCLKDCKKKHRKHSDCRCRKCNKKKEHVLYAEDIERKMPDVPPNTARFSSGVSEDAEKDKENFKSTLTYQSKGRQCASLKQSDNNFQDKKSKKQGKGDKPSHNSNLDPIIKSYVKQLLTLSKEGLKAIEVANEECSSVATPGSSILNIECNRNERKPKLQQKISLEQLKEVLEHKITNQPKRKETKMLTKNHKKNAISRKISTHKIKSLNISKKKIRHKPVSDAKSLSACKNESSKTRSLSNKYVEAKILDSEHRIKNPIPQSQYDILPLNLKENIDLTDITNNESTDDTGHRKKTHTKHAKHKKSQKRSRHISETSSYGKTSTIYSDNFSGESHHKAMSLPSSESNCYYMESDNQLMKIAEHKMQNMQKIADLTERCTQRLTNLAKALVEVRKNKSSIYSHISTSDSSVEAEHKFKSNDSKPQKDHNSKPISPLTCSLKNVCTEELSTISMRNEICKSILQGVPKTTQITPSEKSLLDNKFRGRPPPALSRVVLKQGHDDVIPHELSTVLEVDSPMSVKFKNNAEEKADSFNKSTLNSPQDIISLNKSKRNEYVKLDLLENTARNSNTVKDVKMMDMEKFNEIMLKPFVTIEEFAKKCNVGALDDVSNAEDIQKVSVINDDLSSLHSDGSLPDVIGELLKRKLITEPFQFDTASVVNSTSMSTDSSISALALSNIIVGEKKMPHVGFQNKENVAETSDSISVSSNPDLEKAFKKLGLGWASSTLKKTKERLALSSSSSSTSNTSQNVKVAEQEYKTPLQNRNDNSKSKRDTRQPNKSTIVKDFLTHELADKITFSNKSNNKNYTGKEFISLYETNMPDDIKNASNIIYIDNQKNISNAPYDKSVTTAEFVSLYETKVPDEMKHVSNLISENTSLNNTVNPNRARTSTPVQIYKSVAYHSSSSSNNASNGLFSNMDELSSVKGTSHHSTSDKDDLTIPNCSLRMRRELTDHSNKSE